MATIEVTPIILKDCIIEIDEDDFAAAVNSVVLTPSSTAVVFKGLKPDSVHTDVSSASWTLALGFAQDWTNPDSLSHYLHNNEGATKPALIKPQSGVGPSFSVDIIITPGAIGGTVDQTPTASVNLGVKGRPVLVPAAAAVPVVLEASEITGTDDGGTLVELTGTGFRGATAVHFGADEGEFSVVNDRTIFVVSPAHAAGAVAIKVTNATGQSVTSINYTYA